MEAREFTAIYSNKYYLKVIDITIIKRDACIAERGRVKLRYELTTEEIKLVVVSNPVAPAPRPNLVDTTELVKEAEGKKLVVVSNPVVPALKADLVDTTEPVKETKEKGYEEGPDVVDLLSDDGEDIGKSDLVIKAYV